MEMTKLELINLIKDLCKKFSCLYVGCPESFKVRIGSHISECRIILDISDQISDSGLCEVYDHLFFNYYEILGLLNKKKES